MDNWIFDKVNQGWGKSGIDLDIKERISRMNKMKGGEKDKGGWSIPSMEE